MRHGPLCHEARPGPAHGVASSCLARSAIRAKVLVLDICAPGLAGTHLHVASCTGGRGDSRSVRCVSAARSGRRLPGAGSLRRDFLESHLKSRTSRQPEGFGPGFSILRPTSGSCATERDVIRGIRAPSCRTRSRQQQSWTLARPGGCCGAPRGYAAMPREGRLLHR